MTIVDWDIIIKLVTIVCAGVGVYAAIRSDLREMHIQILHLQDTVKGHSDDIKGARTRMDDHIQNLHVHHRVTD